MNCCENDCCEPSSRQFLTKEERIAKLQTYKKWLDSESKGVDEAISNIKAKA